MCFLVSLVVFGGIAFGNLASCCKRCSWTPRSYRWASTADSKTRSAGSSSLPDRWLFAHSPAAANRLRSCTSGPGAWSGPEESHPCLRLPPPPTTTPRQNPWAPEPPWAWCSTDPSEYSLASRLVSVSTAATSSPSPPSPALAAPSDSPEAAHIGPASRKCGGRGRYN